MASALVSCAKAPLEKRGTPGFTSEGPGTNLPAPKAFGALAPGRIDSVKPKGRYVIISFPIGTMPSVDTLLSVYRKGLKVGEVKVTPPQQNNFTAADIIEGECQVGDEVRSN